MRFAYVVSYDISDPKRLAKTYKLMRGYGDHIQYSVFRCELSASELIELRGKLGEIIHHGMDQVLFVSLGPAAGRARQAIESLGRPYELMSSRLIII